MDTLYLNVTYVSRKYEHLTNSLSQQGLAMFIEISTYLKGKKLPEPGLFHRVGADVARVHVDIQALNMNCLIVQM